MIPKIIHYCWFGGNPLPPLAVKCIKSWKKYCPEYEIIQWNESNYDISLAPLYVQQAYSARKWAFVTDYVRLQVVFENGGIYLDTDVEIKKCLDPFLENPAFFGLEEEQSGVFVATGLGFGAQKNCDVLDRMMADYRDIPFIHEDGSFDQTTCPVRNTTALLPLGLVRENRNQTLEGNIAIFSSEYFCPKSYLDGKIYQTKNTYTVHHFSGSWHTKEQAERKNARWKEERRRQRKHLPFAVVRKLLGESRYEKIRAKLKGR